MSLYRYQSLDRSGKKQSGVIEAPSEQEAKQRLRDQGLMVAELGIKTAASSKEDLSGDALVVFTVQLSQLVGAGIPLYESLLTMEESYRGEPTHRVVMSLANQIREGSSLSKAMETFPNSFNKLYRSMVAAGEAVGSVNSVLTKLVDLLTKRQKMRNQVLTAMIYPAILAGFCLLVIGVLMGFVIPSIETMFEGKKLNAFTNAVLALSHFIRNYWWAYIPLIAGTAAFLVYRQRSPAGKLWWQHQVLKLPLINTLVRETATARFCRTLGTLLEGGLPLIEALRIARETMGNVILERSVEHAEERIIAGGTLSHELTRTGLMPTMAARMLAAGEQSGKMAPMLNRIADIYEYEVEKKLTRLVTLAQPAILIIMGGFIGLVMIAILLPMSNVASLTQSG